MAFPGGDPRYGGLGLGGMAGFNRPLSPASFQRYQQRLLSDMQQHAKVQVAAAQQQQQQQLQQQQQQQGGASGAGGAGGGVGPGAGPGGSLVGTGTPMMHMGFGMPMAQLRMGFFPGPGAAVDPRQGFGGAGGHEDYAARTLRRGKWTSEEETYAQMLIECFKEGSLSDAENGTTLRCYLSRKLNCAPMRISKKYAGQSIGKLIYTARPKASQKVVKPDPEAGATNAAEDTTQATTAATKAANKAAEEGAAETDVPAAEAAPAEAAAEGAPAEVSAGVLAGEGTGGEGGAEVAPEGGLGVAKVEASGALKVEVPAAEGDAAESKATPALSAVSPRSAAEEATRAEKLSRLEKQFHDTVRREAVVLKNVKDATTLRWGQVMGNPLMASASMYNANARGVFNNPLLNKPFVAANGTGVPMSGRPAQAGLPSGGAQAQAAPAVPPAPPAPASRPPDATTGRVPEGVAQPSPTQGQGFAPHAADQGLLSRPASATAPPQPLTSDGVQRGQGQAGHPQCPKGSASNASATQQDPTPPHERSSGARFLRQASGEQAKSVGTGRTVDASDGATSPATGSRTGASSPVPSDRSHDNLDEVLCDAMNAIKGDKATNVMAWPTGSSRETSPPASSSQGFFGHDILATPGPTSDGPLADDGVLAGPAQDLTAKHLEIVNQLTTPPAPGAGTSAGDAFLGLAADGGLAGTMQADANYDDEFAALLRSHPRVKRQEQGASQATTSTFSSAPTTEPSAWSEPSAPSSSREKGASLSEANLRTHRLLHERQQAGDTTNKTVRRFLEKRPQDSPAPAAAGGRERQGAVPGSRSVNSMTSVWTSEAEGGGQGTGRSSGQKRPRQYVEPGVDGAQEANGAAPMHAEVSPGGRGVLASRDGTGQPQSKRPHRPGGASAVPAAPPGDAAGEKRRKESDSFSSLFDTLSYPDLQSDVSDMDGFWKGGSQPPGEKEVESARGKRPSAPSGLSKTEDWRNFPDTNDSDSMLSFGMLLDEME